MDDMMGDMTELTLFENASILMNSDFTDIYVSKTGNLYGIHECDGERVLSYVGNIGELL